MLKLNHEKSELIVFSPKRCAPKFNNIILEFSNVKILPSNSVKLLGVTFDNNLSMENFINTTSRSCFFHLKTIGAIRQFINADTCKILIHALVTSRLDYSNALLHGLPQCAIARLQRVQNTAARVITRTRKHDHITPILKSLHWLPLQYRPQFKVCLCF